MFKEEEKHFIWHLGYCTGVQRENPERYAGTMQKIMGWSGFVNAGICESMSVALGGRDLNGRIAGGHRAMMSSEQRH